MGLNINKEETIDVHESNSQTLLKTGQLCSGSKAIDILRDGVKVDADEEFCEDLESEDLIIQFDFKAIETIKKCFQSKDGNESFEYSALLHKKSKEILIEPLVETYLNLKWQSLRGWWYAYRFVFFMAFGVFLTLMMSFIVEMNNHCKYAELNNKAIESEDKTQRWKLSNNTKLENKEGVWKSDDLWAFDTQWKMDVLTGSFDDDMIYIEYTSNEKVLGATSDGKVGLENFEEGKAQQLWKKGEPDAEGYFTLQISGEPKLLTAISESSLEIKVKPCLTVSGPDSNGTCIFPFNYNGISYGECIDEGHDQFWCQTELPDNTSDLTNNTMMWGNCGPDCTIEGKSKHCDVNNLSTLSIPGLVKTTNIHQQNIEVAYFINVTITAYSFWILYAFTALGVILVAIAELSEAFRDGYKYFTYASNWLDFSNLFCAGLCLILTWTRYKDTAIWFGSTSVLFSWIIIALAVGNMPIVGNWVYLLGNTVKKVTTFLLVFMPLLFGFGLRFRFMFPYEVDGLAESLYNAIFMLVNTFRYEVKDFGKNINESCNTYEYMVKIGTYGTFILALIVLTISFQNILIGLAVNLAKEAYVDAKFNRMWLMAQNLRGIRKFLTCFNQKLYDPPKKAFLRTNRKISKDTGEVWKYWVHVWSQSGRKCLVIFWNAVVLGEHLVYNSKHDAMHQGTIIGTIPEECVEDAISMIKVRNEERLLKSLLTSLVVKKEAEMERERILELLKKFLQNK